MRPWERRLRDLANLLQNCGDTYFSPDRFRQNTNQFLQTSRTVTFIIQKNKADIPDFERWYKAAVTEPWRADPVMTWAKDARNVIEKEGDLEMRSSVEVSVLFSYESDEDLVLDATRQELLRVDIDKMLKLAARQLPPGIADAAVLKIQRRWVANSLPNYELIYALTYAYAELHRVCVALASQLQAELDRTIPHPTALDPTKGDVARVRFIKLKEPGIGRHSSVRIKTDSNFKPTPQLLRLKEELDSAPKTASLADAVSMHAKMAQITFEHHGNHVPMLFLFDRNWNQIDFFSAAFRDQAEKFLFWRNVADRAFYMKAFGMVWISETWIRDMKEHEKLPIHELPIIGERLHVIGADASGAHSVVAWKISRSNPSSSPTLVLLPSHETYADADQIYFSKPVVAAMKLAHANGAG